MAGPLELLKRKDRKVAESASVKTEVTVQHSTADKICKFVRSLQYERLGRNNCQPTVSARESIRDVIESFSEKTRDIPEWVLWTAAEIRAERSFYHEGKAIDLPAALARESMFMFQGFYVAISAMSEGADELEPVLTEVIANVNTAAGCIAALVDDAGFMEDVESVASIISKLREPINAHEIVDYVFHVVNYIVGEILALQAKVN